MLRLILPTPQEGFSVFGGVASQRPALFFFSLPLSFLVAIQRFISTDISRFEDVDARFTPEDAFQAVSLLTASLIYCSCWIVVGRFFNICFFPCCPLNKYLSAADVLKTSFWSVL